jgi:hypothetical protein
MIKNLQLKETTWGQKLLQNINEIKDLIINKKFIPFTSRPNPTYGGTVHYIELMQARAIRNTWLQNIK